MRGQLSVSVAVIATFVCLSIAACSDSPTPPMENMDAGERDAGFGPDAGRLGLCPQEANPGCTKAADCQPDRDKPSGCGGCTPWNLSLCDTAMCVTPPRLGAGDIHNVTFSVGALQNRLKSFSGELLASKTAGGNEITCEQVYAGQIDIADTCYNILDSRGFRAIAVSGDTYRMSFSQFASGQRTLFVVYGYEMENAEGPRIGVSCTTYDVGAPGVGQATEVGGDMMRNIE